MNMYVTNQRSDVFTLLDSQKFFFPPRLSIFFFDFDPPQEMTKANPQLCNALLIPAEALSCRGEA